MKPLPLAVRLPLLISGMIFIVAVGSTQIAIHGMSRQFERHMETLGFAYLDGLSTALLPYAGAGDAGGATEVMERALIFQKGVIDRTLVLLDVRGAVMARVDRNVRPPAEPLPPMTRQMPTGFYIDAEDSSIWVWRSLSGKAPLGTVVANLDIAPLLQARRYLQWSLAGLDFIFSALCALIGIVIARRLQKPHSLLAQYLRDAGKAGPQPIPESVIHAADSEGGEGARLLHAYNAMAAGAREREQMLVRLAEQEREAGLGRLAATIAHEVRNPLTGMLTAIKTLRKFGDRPEVRDEAHDFLERGVNAMREVVNATLKSHRIQREAQPLCLHDLRDVCLLVEAEGKRQDVRVKMEVDLPQIVPVPAAELRQILLNLLLNAVHASPPGGQVTLRGRLAAHELVLDIIDSGDGLNPKIAAGLESGVLPAEHCGLGIAVVVRLVERLGGRVVVQSASVGTDTPGTGTPASGTHLAVHIPLHPLEEV